MIKKERISKVPTSYSEWVLAIGVLLTILAQFIPQLSVAFTVIWFACVLFFGLKYKDTIILSGFPLYIILVSILLGIVCCIYYVGTGEPGYIFGIFQVYAKSMLMYLVGFLAFYVMGIEKARWKKLLIFYVAGSAAYFLWAFLNYFPGFSAWMSSMLYLFASKNSLGQICGVASVLLVLFVLGSRRALIKIACAVVAVIFWAGVLVFQCRTAAVAVVLAVCVALMISKKKKILVILGGLILATIALSPEIQNFIAHGFFLDKLSGQGADAMSSGRLTLWSEAMEVWAEHPFIGVGDYYVDNMYVNVLVNLGFVGFVILMAVWVPRVIFNFKRALDSRCDSKSKWIFRLVASLTAFYLVESVLEGYPPFGPGTCSFLFWMLCGCADAFVASRMTEAHASGICARVYGDARLGTHG